MPKNHRFFIAVLVLTNCGPVLSISNHEAEIHFSRVLEGLVRLGPAIPANYMEGDLPLGAWGQRLRDSFFMLETVGGFNFRDTLPKDVPAESVIEATHTVKMRQTTIEPKNIGSEFETTTVNELSGSVYAEVQANDGPVLQTNSYSFNDYVRAAEDEGASEEEMNFLFFEGRSQEQLMSWALKSISALAPRATAFAANAAGCRYLYDKVSPIIMYIYLELRRI